ncbi:MAG TPA: hypothetical protein VL157_16025 [Gemmatimonadaceae bacterium]|jgi:hypothetical protein|nr:hypothetical protein [Gemmatimonadaceae bacterium]
MTRSIAYLAIAAALANAPGRCSHAGSGSTGSAGTSGASTGNWTSLGATACATYFTPDVTKNLLANPPGTPKTLSAQACSLETSGGNISVTLISDNVAGFDAFSKNLVDPQPLAGVGDKALQHMTGIAAYKAPDRVCTIDAVGAPGFVKPSGEALGQALGAVCNKLFAANP